MYSDYISPSRSYAVPNPFTGSSDQNIIQNIEGNVKKYAPILLIAGTGLLLFDILASPSHTIKFSSIFTLASFGMMAVGGYFIFFNAASPTSHYAVGGYY